MQRWQEDKQVYKIRGWPVIIVGPLWKAHWKIRDRQCEATRDVRQPPLCARENIFWRGQHGNK